MTRDESNLHFIRSLTQEQFNEWIKEISYEDIMYALELLQLEHAKMIVQEMELTDDVVDLTQTQQLLKHVRGL